MCRRIRDILATVVEREWWSKRAKEAMAEARNEYHWLTTDGTVVTSEPNSELMWWTFAGRAVNTSLAYALQSRISGKVAHDNFAVKVETGSTLSDFETHIAAIRSQPHNALLPEIDADAITAIKFSDCIPHEMAQHMLQLRATDGPSLGIVLTEPVRFIVVPE